MEEFNLDGREFVELNSLMKLVGMCQSGGAAKMAIAEGLVTVDGQVELRKRCKLRPGQSIEFESKKVIVCSE